MKTKILIEGLARYRKWFDENGVQAKNEYEERKSLAKKVQDYNEEKLLNMSEEDFFDYIAPLWAMAMWGNKHYQIDSIINANGMEVLRKQFANLIYGESRIEKRWDEFRINVKGVGPAIMSELLCKKYPDSFLLWNKKTYNGFLSLEIENLPRYEAGLNGKKYFQLCEIAQKIISDIKSLGYNEIVTDMFTLNSFIWKELQEPIKDCEVELNKNEKLSNVIDDFIHNDIRDKIAEIGRFLGFNAEIEKKVANGAVVDAVWEVSIGNMGRVTYVFEVQRSGSIDSLILNFIKCKSNKVVQAIVAVSDQKQIEKIKREISCIDNLKNEVIFWDYEEVLKIHEYLQFVNESINNLGLVPKGL